MGSTNQAMAPQGAARLTLVCERADSAARAVACCAAKGKGSVFAGSERAASGGRPVRRRMGTAARACAMPCCAGDRRPTHPRWCQNDRQRRFVRLGVHQPVRRGSAGYRLRRVRERAQCDRRGVGGHSGQRLDPLFGHVDRRGDDTAQREPHRESGVGSDLSRAGAGGSDSSAE